MSKAGTAKELAKRGYLPLIECAKMVMSSMTDQGLGLNAGKETRKRGFGNIPFE
jgi:hypothetical protein